MYAKQLTIVIPSPNVVANHQELNAKELHDLGILQYLLETEVNINSLYQLMQEMLKEEAKYQKAMENYAKLSAVDIIKKEIVHG